MTAAIPANDIPYANAKIAVIRSSPKNIHIIFLIRIKIKYHIVYTQFHSNGDLSQVPKKYHKDIHLP